MSKSKELSLASNSNSKSNLSSGNFTSKFCCTKANSIDETKKDPENNTANILIENDFKFIDEETTCNSSNTNLTTTKIRKEPLKSNPKSHVSSQAVFCNKKNETINEAQNPNKKKESASQPQILEEVGSNKSTDNCKRSQDGFGESVYIPSHNEVNKADNNESNVHNGSDQKNLPENKNYGEREAAEKSQKYFSKDQRDAEKKTEKQKGGLVRVIITNFKQAAEDEAAKISGTAVNSSVGAQKDVNPTVNETTIKGDLDHHKAKPGKMCSGVTRSDESDNNVCLSDKFQEGVSEVIKKNLSDMNDQKANLEVSGSGSSEKGDLASIMLNDDDDPYNELQEYLEKIKREINEAFEQHQQRNDELPRCSSPDSTASSNKLPSNERQFFLNDIGNGRELNEICSSQESGKLTAANMSTGSPDYDQEKLKLENRLKCLIRQERHTEESNRNSSSHNARDSGDVNVWANSILKELDNLMASDKHAAAKSKNATSEKARTRNILKPEKHATIPLQSFNLNVKSTESKSPQPKKFAIANNPKTSSLFPNKGIPMQDVAKEDSSKYPLSILKIEEDTKQSSEMGSSPTSKKEVVQQNHVLLNEAAKKGSTSTLWTSEESILRSAGTVDEDNKSTSSSACEDTSIVLSSGKSGNSLDSSENDIDSNEISPSTSRANWNNTKLQNSITKQNSREICDSYPFRKSKPCTNSPAIGADDPDLLEVLSLCGGGVNYDDDLFNSNINYFDAMDSKNSDTEDSEVVLRNKPKLEINENRPQAISMPVDRNRKCRSHSIAESSFPLIPSECEIYDKFPNKNAKPKRPFYLPFTQEPFRNGNSSNIRELPSPSSASLHSGHENMVIQELTTKSNSAPILLKKEKRNDVFSVQQNSLRYSRSQSDRYLAEIEAVEACKWLRAAGFPQYAQMYEDHQFPIDLSSVAKDHPLLENDPLQSLYRRLAILNKCAARRVDSARKHSQQKDDSDDEGFALSENWMFQPQSRRWSRIGETGLEIPTKQLQDKADCSSKESSPDRFEDNVHAANLAFSTLPLPSDPNQSECDAAAANRLRRTGSERLKDGAKALLRRVESIKSRRRKRQNREGLVISGPQVLDLNNLTPKSIKTVNVTLSNPPSPSTSPVAMYPRGPLFGNELKIPSESEKFLSPNRLSPKRIPAAPRSIHSTHASPLHFFANTMPHLVEGKSDDSSSYCSDSQDSNSGLVTMRRQTHRSRRFLQRTGKVDDIGVHSDSECHQPSGRKMIFKDTNSNNTEVKVKKLTRGGSLNLGRDSKKVRGSLQSRSFRSRSSVRKNIISSESDKEDSKKSKSPVVRWHSFREKDHPPLMFKKCSTGKSESRLEGTSFAAMSCGQLQIIRKLALVTLTGYMERYCPSHRSGWNWELPKFIKKIKTPDYKDKKVFGVPFLLVLQRSGYSVPFPIRAAFRWLRLNAYDQIGLFRKSGVKSRIAKLKELVESSDVDCMDIYDTQQAYDVADMLKQYFRDLPETLLTSKMSETFVAIFHHLPHEVRAEAVQSAVLLLPDENREVLYSLLEFLNEIAAHSQYNQMNANNLAVCWAPSLFSNNIAVGRSTAVSPRRRKVVGVPDMKELSETKASHECLSFMISHFKQIFTASHEKMKHCNFGYMEESKPVPLEALGEGLPFQNWRGYLYECTSATIKEGREKTRGWVSIASLDSSVEIAFKKVGDGHPLRLWRCITEVEAPPIEVLDYILKERTSWDINLMKSRTVQKLDERNEIYQYTCDGQTPTDYCVLRSWQSDLPKGACVIVETSVEHPSAPIMHGAVRGVVLAARFLIEPCGSGRSRVMHLARVDTKGRTPEFYNKCYGHICSHYLSKIRTAFRHVTEGPESKV